MIDQLLKSLEASRSLEASGLSPMEQKAVLQELIISLPASMLCHACPQTRQIVEQHITKRLDDFRSEEPVRDIREPGDGDRKSSEKEDRPLRKKASK